MKLSQMFVAGLVFIDAKENSPPVHTIDRLVRLSDEIVESAIWRSYARSWVRHIEDNAWRMKTNFYRRCGYYDEKLVIDFFDVFLFFKTIEISKLCSCHAIFLWSVNQSISDFIIP